MGYSRKEMIARFWELQDQIEKVEKASAPLREVRDRFVNETRAKEAKLNADIHKAEQGLFEMKQELGIIARAVVTVGQRPKKD